MSRKKAGQQAALVQTINDNSPGLFDIFRDSCVADHMHEFSNGLDHFGAISHCSQCHLCPATLHIKPKSRSARFSH